MEKQDELLVLQHLREDPELMNLWKNHQNFEQKLKKMENKTYLSSEEKIEKKRLQLAKLAGKTKIEAILERYRIIS